jgi:hypothetical protein
MGYTTPMTFVDGEVGTAAQMNEQLRDNMTSVHQAIYTPLAIPLVSTAWDGDAKTAANNGVIDLSSVFAVPALVRAVAVLVQITASAASRSLSLGTDSAHTDFLLTTQVAGVPCNGHGIVNCDANGDIYVSIGADLSAVILAIVGYWTAF